MYKVERRNVPDRKEIYLVERRNVPGRKVKWIW